MELNEYFLSYKDYFWQWEDGGDVMGIPNGNTIAYRAFVVDVLEKLVNQGIPPFGALLLAIIATNPKAEDDLNTVYALISRKQAENNSLKIYLEGAISFLKMLAQIPWEYKAGKNRLLLLQTLFANCHNILSVPNSRIILQLYRSRKERSNALFGEKNVKSIPPKDFQIIALLSKKFPTVQSIIDGIANLPPIEKVLEIEEEGSTDTGSKDFVQELTENHKTFYIGSLIKRLWSGLNIPFHNSLPSRQPMGGISDLTNKGDFDRLLISEFANDHLVFLSRLANNEALYINREIPPHNNNLERVILIDVSIKNWGTPRTIAYALMLAIAKHPKTDINCSAFAVGNSYNPLAFDSVNSVIEGLQHLDGCLHPGKGLEQFFNGYKQDRSKEVFFISSTETMRQPAFQKVLGDYHDHFRYCLYTDAAGSIDLYKRQHNSRKHVQHIQLPLEDLWEKEASIKKRDNAKEKKTIFHSSPYPILFSGSPNPKKIFIANDGEIFQITADRKLMRLYQKTEKPDEMRMNAKGWQMIQDNLPLFYNDYQIGKLDHGDYVLLLFNRQNREVILLNIHTGKQETVAFKEWRSSQFQDFLFHNNQFYFLTNVDTYAISCYPEVKIVACKKELRQQLIKLYQQKEAATKNWTQQLLYPSAILKNISSVFINQVSNLVLNQHELRLNNYMIRLEKTGFLQKRYEANRTKKNEFTFSNGSTITINRAGMLTLQNKDHTIYIPSILNETLGAATKTDFAGSSFYQPTGNKTLAAISTTKFWDQYIIPFIENIKQNGA